jgi:hypothetical protein
MELDAKEVRNRALEEGAKGSLLAAAALSYRWPEMAALVQEIDFVAFQQLKQDILTVAAQKQAD